MDEKISCKIPPGEKVTIRNPNPVSGYFELKTSGGTFVSFPVAAFSEFDVVAGGDLVSADLVFTESHHLGPRSVKKDAD